MANMIKSFWCWLFHFSEWKTTAIFNNEGELSRYEMKCKNCNRKWEA